MVDEIARDPVSQEGVDPIKQDYDARLQHFDPANPLAKAGQTLSSVLPRDKPNLPLAVQSSTSAASYICRVLAVVTTPIGTLATTTQIGVLGEDACVAAASAVQGNACEFGLHLITCAFTIFQFTTHKQSVDSL